MKKLFLVIFFIVVLFVSFFYKGSYGFFYDDVNNNFGYNVYELYFNGLNLEEYKDIFASLNEDDYIILGFSFDNNYNIGIKNKINDIEIVGGNYINALLEYSDKYVNYLNDEREISKIKSGGMKIVMIKILTTSLVYEKIKKDAKCI